MTTSTAAHISHRPATTTTTALKPSSLSPTSTASKLGDCCSREAISTHPYGLQECPTKFLLLTPVSHAAVDLPVDDDQRRLAPYHAAEDTADDDELSTYLTKWCDRNDEEFDYSSELDAIADACERMQRRPTAATTETPTTTSNATTHTQQSPLPMLPRSTSDDEELDFSSVIDALVIACNRMQQRWPSVTTTVAPPSSPTEPTPEQPTQSDPLAILAALEEFISTPDDRLDECIPSPAIHRQPLSFDDICLLQAQVQAKLIDMISDLNQKIALLTNANNCPQQRPLDSTTNAPMIPISRPLLHCTLPSPLQQYTVLELLQPKGSFATLCASTPRIQLAPVSYPRAHHCFIPAKPPFDRVCNLLLQTKDSMCPP